MRRESLKREELFDLFHPPSNNISNGPRDQLPLQGGGGGPTIEVAWPDESETDSIPSFCIVKKDSMRDFLAWAATYLPSASPLTALCRVVTPETFNSLPRQKPRLQRRRGIEGGIIGVIFTEALTYFESKDDSSKLSAAACARTLSHALARAMFLGYDWPMIQRAGTAWHELREVTGQTTTVIPTYDVQTCWSVTYALYTADPNHKALGDDLKTIVAACEDIQDGSDISKNRWLDLTGSMDGLANLRDLMTGPREERVLIVEKLLGIAALQNRLPDHKLAFAVAYLASRISPGTLDHLGLLRSRVPFNSPVFLWYGLCSGLSSRGDLRDYSSGLSLRVLRDLLRPASIHERPDSDLSVEELKVLMSGAPKESGMRPGTPGFLEVELIPFVTTTVRWPGSRTSSLGEPLNPALVKDVARLVDDIASLAKRADYIAYSLSKYFPDMDQADPSKRLRRRRP